MGRQISRCAGRGERRRQVRELKMQGWCLLYIIYGEIRGPKIHWIHWLSLLGLLLVLYFGTHTHLVRVVPLEKAHVTADTPPLLAPNCHCFEALLLLPLLRLPTATTTSNRLVLVCFLLGALRYRWRMCCAGRMKMCRASTRTPKASWPPSWRRWMDLGRMWVDE